MELCRRGVAWLTKLSRGSPFPLCVQGTGKDEPTVWVGLKEQVRAGLNAERRTAVCSTRGAHTASLHKVLANGSVAQAYPTSYANTQRAEWGMEAMNTSDYIYGASSVSHVPGAEDACA